jgi:hypothetical protein
VLAAEFNFLILELKGGEKPIKSSIALSYLGDFLLFSLNIVIKASLIATTAAP